MNKSQAPDSVKTCTINLHGCLTTFSLSDHEQFKISSIDQENQCVYNVEFDKTFLAHADPTILSTFDDINTMYDELVEIAKTQPNDFIIQPSGIIKVLITMSMKSGSKKKQLVFQTEKKPMELAETLQLQLRRSQKINAQQQQQLREQIDILKKKLHQTQKQNSQMSAMLTQIRSEVRLEVTELKNKIQNQKSDLSAILGQLRANVEEIKKNLAEVQQDIDILRNGFKRNMMKGDQNCHSVKNNNKDKFFSLENEQITKIGNLWAQILSQEYLRSPKSYFEIKINKTKKNYICIGIGSPSCKNQDDSKWEKSAITLFLLDNSIIIEGKSAEDLGVKDKFTGYKAKEGDIIRVLVDLNARMVSWKVKEKVLGKIQMSQEFAKLGENSQIYPLVICQDEGDKVSGKTNQYQ